MNVGPVPHRTDGSGGTVTVLAPSANFGLLDVDGRLAPRAWLLVGLLALLVGLPSLGNGFAYDDVYVIAKDARIQDLAQWRTWWTLPYWTDPPHGVYRPLMTTLFALEWAIGRGAPWVFHAVNLALHTAVSASVLWLMSLLLAPRVAVMVAAMFAAHPVHVEAVANVVGQSELIVGLSLAVGTALYLTWRREGPIAWRRAVVLGSVFAVGVLSKEHAFVLPGLWLAAEVTVLRGTGQVTSRLREAWLAYLAVGLVACLALVARWRVLGSIEASSIHGALVGLGVGGRMLVMLSIVPELVRLLAWPARLHADYSPLHVVLSADPSLIQLPGFALVVGAVGLMVWAWRREPRLAFAGSFLLLPWLPTANILFPSGVLLAERALYSPSIGFLLACGLVVQTLIDRAADPWRAVRLIGTAAGLLLVLGAARSMTRAPVWASSASVFKSLVDEQPLSVKAHVEWGVVLAERGELDAALAEWRIAARIAPGTAEIHDLMGRLLAHGGRCDAAVPELREAIRLGGQQVGARMALVQCLIRDGHLPAARRELIAGQEAGIPPESMRTLEAELEQAERAGLAPDAPVPSVSWSAPDRTPSSQ